MPTKDLLLIVLIPFFSALLSAKLNSHLKLHGSNPIAWNMPRMLFLLYHLQDQAPLEIS